MAWSSHILPILPGFREQDPYRGTPLVPPAAGETGWPISADGLTWPFTLREDVTFHDGTPLGARDVLASFERLRFPDRPHAPNPDVVWPALFRGLPGVVKELQAPDARTFQMILVQIGRAHV